MILEIGLIVVGVPLGYALHKKPKAVGFTNHALSGIIYALLFFIGLNLGGNENLLSRMGELGLQGTVIGVLSALGSVFVVCFLFRSFFTKQSAKSMPQGEKNHER